MLYLTFNDPPSGIYFSQVTDVCRFIRSRLNTPARLVAFISIRDFRKNKKEIRHEAPDAIVLPMFPGVKNWKWNRILLGLRLMFSRQDTVIARGPFAALLALGLKRKGYVKAVCFDARGAYTAEFREYNVSGVESINESIEAIEREALEGSDMQLAVSHALVHYWQERFGFKVISPNVIPCTLGDGFTGEFSAADHAAKRKELGVKEDEVLMVYSGSHAGWQSLDAMMSLFGNMLAGDERIKLLLLTPRLKAEWDLERWGSRVIQRWVTPAKVRPLLMAGDYGLLIREESVTNAVSSPVKFAEYLACGLKVVISEGVGDYSALVRSADLGICIRKDEIPRLAPVTRSEKERMASFALATFTKNAYIETYRNIILNKH